MSRLQSAIDRKSKGFTIIELMVVIAIMCVGFAIALPAINQYMVKNKRVGAKAVLLEIVSQEERYAAVNRAYVAADSTAAVESGLGLTIPGEVKSVYDFTITLDSVGAGISNTFVATAVPVAGSSQEGDGTLRINKFGLRTPTEKW